MHYRLFLLLLVGLPFQMSAQKNLLMPQVGIAIPLENDSIVTAIGYTCIVESIGKRISPKSVSDADFQKNVRAFKALKTPVYACNLFIPGDMKLVGPEVNEKAILEYVEQVMARLSQTNTKMIVWGSGGARRVPDGFDKKTATKQFIAIGKKIAAIAQKYGITIALENLNSTETNFINTIREALYVVKKINHPNLRLNVDIYHMLKEGEAPDIIAKTKKYLVYVEIAEKENRTLPGITGTNFKPYLEALKKVGYHQKIVMEGRWKTTAELETGYRFLTQQIEEVYK